jgi:hypothetical protein
VIAALIDHVASTLAKRTPLERGRAHALIVGVLLHLVLVTVIGWWYVEDSAISFSFARRAASGDGFVAYAGGERVEGFSNPTWTLLLTVLDLVGVNPWIGARLLGVGCGVATILGAAALMRRLEGDGQRFGAWPALVPVLLGLNPQHAIWTAAGLENPLFTALLTWGVVHLLDEVQGRARGRLPWSALLFGALAATRPEAPMYVAVAGVAGVVIAASRPGVDARGRLVAATGWAVRWGVLCLGPLALWHAWRYAYFAWPFPNTYYAKLGQEEVKLLDWGGKGWTYLRNWGLVTGWGFAAPAFLLGLGGVRGARLPIGIGVGLALLALVLPAVDFPWTWSGVPRPAALPDFWDQATAIGAWSAAGIALALGLGRHGAAARSLMGALAVVSVFFCVYSAGDWMKGYRWMSFPTPLLTVLAVDAIRSVTGALTRAWPSRPRVAAAFALLTLGGPTVAGLVSFGVFAVMPETSPYDVRRRVLYVQQLMDRLHLDRAALLEVDMGAHMWFSTIEVVDMAGLVDVPMAHSAYDKPYIQQYVFQERNPEFAHVHGSWATRTKLKTHKEFARYLEVPAYAMSPWVTHPGSHVDKALLVGKERAGQGRAVVFGDGAIELGGWDVPAPITAAGGALYVELGFGRSSKAPTDFRPVIVLTGPDGAQRAWDVPPAYDWLPPKKWRAHEYTQDKHALPLGDLPAGTYDVSIVLFGDHGGVLAARAAPRGATLEAPRYARGEVTWPAAVVITAEPEAAERGDELVAAAIATAAAGDCDEAEASWVGVRRIFPRDSAWYGDRGPAVRAALAACRAREASGPALHDRAVDAIVAARAWDHRDATVLEVGAALADAWIAEGEALQASGDVKGAQQRYTSALLADPTRAWTRRRVEELRRAWSDAEDAERKRKEDERKQKKDKSKADPAAEPKASPPDAPKDGAPAKAD